MQRKRIVFAFVSDLSSPAATLDTVGIAFSIIRPTGPSRCNGKTTDHNGGFKSGYGVDRDGHNGGTPIVGGGRGGHGNFMVWARAAMEKRPRH